jgi:hypothetical protein
VVLRRMDHLTVSPLGEDPGMRNDTTDLPGDPMLTSRFEPCHAFLADLPGSPVCAGCGWLDGEHTARANVHRLPRRAAPPRRLAS